MVYQFVLFQYLFVMFQCLRHQPLRKVGQLLRGGSNVALVDITLSSSQSLDVDV